MSYMLRDRPDGQVEIILTKPILIGIFPERDIAQRVCTFLQEDAVDWHAEEPAAVADDARADDMIDPEEAERALRALVDKTRNPPPPPACQEFAGARAGAAEATTDPDTRRTRSADRRSEVGRVPPHLRGREDRRGRAGFRADDASAARHLGGPQELAAEASGRGRADRLLALHPAVRTVDLASRHLRAVQP